LPKEKKYKFSFLRLFSILSLPLILLTILILMFYERLFVSREIETTILFGFVFMLFWSIGVFLLLFFNHLSIVRTTVMLVLDKKYPEKEITVFQTDKKICFQVSEVTQITEYSTSKLPWSGIKKWHIKTNETEVWISSLTISSFRFEELFYNKIEDKTSFFPILKK
jgi:hypothetical protein